MLDIKKNVQFNNVSFNYNFQKCSENFFYLLNNFLKNSSENKNTIGCEISGGLDSNTIVYMLNNKYGDKNLYGFSYIYKDNCNFEKIKSIYDSTKFKPIYIDLNEF